MSSELLRDEPVPSVAPIWRVVNGSSIQESTATPLARQLEQKFQEGRQRGLAEAMAASRKDAEAQLQPMLERLAQSLVEVAETRQRIRDETASDLVRLSLAIASRILHRETTLDPDAIHGLLKAAFDKTQSREITRVLVHPSYEASLRNFLEQMSSPAAIEIVTDPRLDGGTILLETTQGQLDASIDTQLKEIERGLADRIHH